MKAVAVRLHLPHCSHLMTDVLVLGDLYNPGPLNVCLLQFANHRSVSAGVGELFVATLKISICHNALHHIIYFVFPHWLYFKPHVVIWPSVCLDGEVKWTSRLQLLRSATHKLLKKSHWASFSTNGKHLWLKIGVLCVQTSLSGFGVPFSELYEIHAIVIFA